jgi:hypothetical protein
MRPAKRHQQATQRTVEEFRLKMFVPMLLMVLESHGRAGVVSYANTVELYFNNLFYF